MALYINNATILSDAIDRAMAVVTVSSCDARHAFESFMLTSVSSRISLLRMGYTETGLSCSITVYCIMVTMGRIWLAIQAVAFQIERCDSKNIAEMLS